MADHAPSPDPTDTPLREVSDRLDAGSDAQFQVVAGGDVLCLTCRTRIPGDGVDVSRMTRLEGVSDPADMAMVVPIACPNCGASGGLVLGYGPNAGEAEADFLTRSRRHPDPAAPGVAT